MAIEFFNDGTHRCVEFNDLAGEGDVQANQNLIINGKKACCWIPEAISYFPSFRQRCRDSFPTNAGIHFPFPPRP
jgi:hypothetical protein